MTPNSVANERYSFAAVAWSAAACRPKRERRTLATARITVRPRAAGNGTAIRATCGRRAALHRRLIQRVAPIPGGCCAPVCRPLAADAGDPAGVRPRGRRDLTQRGYAGDGECRFGRTLRGTGTRRTPARCSCRRPVRWHPESAERIVRRASVVTELDEWRGS